MPASLSLNAKFPFEANFRVPSWHGSVLEFNRAAVLSPVSDRPRSGFKGAAMPAQFGAISGIIISTLEKFLDSFKTAIPEAPASFNEEFFTNFLVTADVFASQCCDEFAKMICESSTRPEVRETRQPIVARLVRTRCFESLDLALIEYLQILEELGIHPKKFSAQLSDSRIRGFVAEREGNYEPVGPRIRRHVRLASDLRALALLKILGYLKRMEFLAQELLDYGAVKLFGGDIDFVAQKTYLKSIKDGIQGKLREAIAIVDSIGLVKQKRWEEQCAADLAAVEAAIALSSTKYVRSQGCAGSFLIGLVCLLPVWLVSHEYIISPYIAILAMVSGIAGVLQCYSGINRLTRP